MTEWTAERLDAMPDGTLIEAEALEGWWVRMSDGDWWLVGEDYYDSSAGIVAENEDAPIRVVSVPIDALLSQNALEAATDAFAMTTNLVGILGNEAEQAVRAAIAHVTRVWRDDRDQAP